MRRELREETGLAITADPPHVWHQEVRAANHPPGFDGIINDYFLIRATHFQPRGELTDNQLAAQENLTAFRWWHLSEIAGHTEPELFSPRDLTTPLTALSHNGDAGPTAPTRPLAKFRIQAHKAVTHRVRASARTCWAH